VPDTRPGPDRRGSGHGKLAVQKGPPGGKEQVMTEQQRPDEDVEGHMPWRREDAADEVEGHRLRRDQLDPKVVDADQMSDDDDVEGHKKYQ
jgi:hypothetical protein